MDNSVLDRVFAEMTRQTAPAQKDHTSCTVAGVAQPTQKHAVRIPLLPPEMWPGRPAIPMCLIDPVPAVRPKLRIAPASQRGLRRWGRLVCLAGLFLGLAWWGFGSRERQSRRAPQGREKSSRSYKVIEKVRPGDKVLTNDLNDTQAKPTE